MLPWLEPVVDLAFFTVGCLAIAWLLRRWQGGPRPAVLAAYALLALAFTAPALLTPRHQVVTDSLYRVPPWVGAVEGVEEVRNPLLVDPLLQMYPLRSLVRDRLLSGEAPLWSHELGTGQPLLGDAQSAPFAPFHVMALPLPPLRAMTVAAAWQLFLALLLTHALLVRLGARPAAAAVSAVAFALCTFMVAWLYYPMGMAAAWLPGVLLGTLELHRGGRGAVAGTVACAVGMATSGHPETLAHTALVAGGVALALLARAPAGGRMRYLGRLAGSAGLAAAFAAPVLLPLLEALPESQRIYALAADPPRYFAHFRAANLPPFLDPLVYGSPRADNWTGPGNFNEVCSGWAGLAALALALAGAVWLRGRVAAVVLGGAALALAGLGVEPFLGAVQALPLLEHGAHGRLRLVWALAVAVAAGLTLERLVPGGAERPPRGLAVAAATALVLAVAGVALLPPPLGVPWQRAWFWTALAGTGLLATTVAVPRLRRFAAPVALLAVTVDLFVLGVGYNPAVPRDRRAAEPPALEFLAERAAGGPWRVAAEDGALQPNTGALWDLWDPRGNDPMRPAAPAAHLARRLEGRAATPDVVSLELGEADYRFLDFLSVRYLLIPGTRRMPPPWRRVFHGVGGRVWENGAVVDLFYVPPRVVPAHSGEEAWRLAANLVDVVDVAVVEGLERRRELPGPLGGRQEGEVELTAVTSNGFRLHASCPSGCVVASSVSHAAAWRLWVDGEADEPLRLHRAFLALGVPPGEHDLVLEYRPAGWPLGLASAGLAALGCLGWAVRRRRLVAPPRSRML